MRRTRVAELQRKLKPPPAAVTYPQTRDGTAAYPTRQPGAAASDTAGAAASDTAGAAAAASRAPVLAPAAGTDPHVWQRGVCAEHAHAPRQPRRPEGAHARVGALRGG
eukprot:4598072-Prymnesium_polylepis.1